MAQCHVFKKKVFEISILVEVPASLILLVVKRNKRSVETSHHTKLSYTFFPVIR